VSGRTVVLVLKGRAAWVFAELARLAAEEKVPS